MIDLPVPDIVGRLLVTQHRVEFSQCDPYGHMASGQYIHLLMDHRITVQREQLHADAIRLVAERGIGYFLRDVQLTFLAPSQVASKLEVVSWLRAFDERDFHIRALVVGADDRIARAAATMQFTLVDVKSGRPMPMFAAMPCSAADVSVVKALPTVPPYLDTVKRLPKDWKEAATVEAQP